MKLHLPVILRKAVLACSAVVAACTLYSGNLAAAADITLTDTDSLTIDYSEPGAITDLEGGTLQLMGDTPLLLSNCGEGDGKTYTLFTGISQLTDKEGHVLPVGSYTVADYFDTTLPGTGFWAEATLQLTQDGTLQLVCHNEAVKAAQIITVRQPNVTEYSCFEGIKFQDIYTTIENTSNGGAIEGDTVTLSNNGSVVFRENETSLNIRTIGGAICGPNGVTLENNGSVLFIKNTANSPTNVYGGAIFGDWPSTITLSNNENVTFSENTAASLDGVAFGGAIEGDTILINNNGSVSFGQNKANSLSLLDYNDSEGGAIRGRTITLNNNNSVLFNGNTASCNSGRALGGAIRGLGPLLTLCGNNDLTFSRNTVSSNGKEALGGAIHTYYNNLSIQNNGSVLFEKNTEINNGTYRLRSIYTSGTGNVISLSAAEGKSIEFRDSVYIDTGSTVSFNADYTDTAGIIHQQAGDIIFTGATTEDDLLAVKGSAGTDTEIANSRTTEVLTMTNLYGGRLCVEDGAIYKGYGITAIANSGSTVSVRNATLRHSGYDLLFNSGTTLELQGCNTITGNLNMLDGSTLHVDFTGNDSVTGLGNSNLTLSGDMQLLLTGAGNGDGKTYILFTDIAQLLDKEGNVLAAGNYTVGGYFDTTRPGTGFWADAALQLTQEGTLQLVMHNEAVKEALTITTHQTTSDNYSYYKEVSFNDISSANNGGAIVVSNNIEINNNGLVTFSRNKSRFKPVAHGGAIYAYGATSLCNNGSVIFSENMASNGGGVYVYDTLTLNNNGNILFYKNSATITSSYTDGGGAIYGDYRSIITLNNNGSLEFFENSAYHGGAIGGRIDSIFSFNSNRNVIFNENKANLGGAIYGIAKFSNNGNITFCRNAATNGSGGVIYTDDGGLNELMLADNQSVIFCENSASLAGGAIYNRNECPITMNGNNEVRFCANSAGSNGGAIYREYSSPITLNNNKIVEFRENSAGTSGGAIYVIHDSPITMNDNESVTFSGNTAKDGGAIYGDYENSITLRDNDSVIFCGNRGSTCGGAIHCITVFLNDNGNVVFNENTSINSSDDAIGGAISSSDISIRGNKHVEFSENIASGSGAYFNGYEYMYGEAQGGAIYGYHNDIEFIGNDSVHFCKNRAISEFGFAAGGAIFAYNMLLSENQSVSFIGNETITSGRAVGGAIYALDGDILSLSNNDSVTFSGNKAVSLSGDAAVGGAMYVYMAGPLRIQNNGSALFEKNVEISNDTYRLRSISASTTVYLSAAEGNSIEFYDSVHLYKSNHSFNLNADYTDANGVTHQQKGDILFTGKNTETHLNELLADDGRGRTATEDEILRSRTSEVYVMTNLYGGRLRVEDGAVYQGYGITVVDDANATILLKNATLKHDGYDITLNRGNCLSLSGINTASAKTLNISADSILSFSLDSENLTSAVLTFSGDFNLVGNGSLQIHISTTDDLLDGQYKLLTKTKSSYTVFNPEDVDLTINNEVLSSASLQWLGNTLYFNYRNIEPLLVVGTWSNESGDGKWNTSSANWEQSGIDYAYKDGVAVVFGDAGAGKVTLEGILAPSSVLVNSREDYSFDGTGSLTGGMSLTKQGSGTLTITTNNSYTGGTTIEGGRLEVDHTNALGTGDVALNNGTLDLNSYAVGNDIFATGGTLEGGDNFGGKLTVNGDLTLGGETTAGGGILLQGGSISGGSIVDTDITVNGPSDMEISSDIRGNSSLTLNNGNLTVSGSNNNYTGGTTINNGNLTIGSGSSLGSGNITLNGGTLNTNGQEITNNIVNNGGSLISSYVLGKGHTLTVGKGGMSMEGNLTLAGGNLHFKGLPLTVDGKVTSTAPVNVLVSGYSVIDKEGTIHLADFGDNTVGMTAASFNNVGYGTLSYDETKNTLSITLTNKNIWVGGKGATWIQGTNVGWANGETFVVGNRALFNTKGTVTITGAVEPASALVDVDKSLTFKTSYNKKTWLYSGSIVGNGCVVKRGVGKLTMNDGNTYSGGTFIEAGTVNALGTMSFGTGAITLSGGTLNLASKVVANDIELTDSAIIKGGKKYLGAYTQTDGELMKGSVLNIAKTATLTGGVMNGTLSGYGTVAVTGDAAIGTSGKVTTYGLEVSGTLAVSNKGLAMNTKTSAINVKTGGKLLSEGALKAAALTVDGGLLELHSAKASSISITNNTYLANGAAITAFANVKTANLTMKSGSQLTLGTPRSNTWAFRPSGGGSSSASSAAALSLTVSGNMNLTSSALTLGGKITAGNLTITDSYVNMTSGKLQTIAVKNTLTLSGNNCFIFNFEATNGTSYKLFTFSGFHSDGTSLYELLGWEQNGSYTLTANAKDITLTVKNALAWENYMDELMNSGATATLSMDDALVESAGTEKETEQIVVTAAGIDPRLGKVADTLVQSTWGTAGASRAFGDTIAARGTHATALADGKAAAWISTMGGSSRISSDGGHAGADYTLTGAAFGMETRLSEKSTVGLAIGNSWGKVSTFSAFPVDQDSTHQGIYGKHLLGSSTTLSWMAAHTRTESDAKLAGMACDWTQDALQLDARVDKLFAIRDRTTVSAFVGMQYLATDKGECNGLSSGSLQNLRGEIGVSATHKTTDRTYIYGELSFVGDMVRHNPTATVGDYRSRGANPGRAGLNLSVGASYQLNDSWSLNGSYSLELMQNQTSHSANVGATYSF